MSVQPLFNRTSVRASRPSPLISRWSVNVLTSQLKEMSGTRQQVRRAWLALIKKIALKAFVQVGVATDVQTAYQVLVSCAGLGGLDTNTVVVPLYLAPESRRARDQLSHDAVRSAAGERGTLARSGSYYTNMATKLTNIEPIMTPGGPIANESGDGEEVEGKTDPMATPQRTLPRKSSLARANAIDSGAEWVSILRDTLLLERNILVEV